MNNLKWKDVLEYKINESTFKLELIKILEVMPMLGVSEEEFKTIIQLLFKNKLEEKTIYFVKDGNLNISPMLMAITINKHINNGFTKYKNTSMLSNIQNINESSIENTLENTSENKNFDMGGRKENNLLENEAVYLSDKDKSTTNIKTNRKEKENLLKYLDKYLNIDIISPYEYITSKFFNQILTSNEIYTEEIPRIWKY